MERQEKQMNDDSVWLVWMTAPHNRRVTLLREEISKTSERWFGFKPFSTIYATKNVRYGTVKTARTISVGEEGVLVQSQSTRVEEYIQKEYGPPVWQLPLLASVADLVANVDGSLWLPPARAAREERPQLQAHLTLVRGSRLSGL